MGVAKVRYSTVLAGSKSCWEVLCGLGISTGSMDRHWHGHAELEPEISVNSLHRV